MEYKEENKMEQKDEVVKQIDLIEIIKEMCKHIKLYSIVCISSGILGIIVAFSIPKVYSSSVVLAPEMGNNNSIGGGLSSLASMAGIDLNIDNLHQRTGENRSSTKGFTKSHHIQRLFKNRKNGLVELSVCVFVKNAPR